MASYSFLFPMIINIPRGYDLNVVVPTASVERYLAVKDCELACDYTIRSEGQILQKHTSRMRFEGGRFVGDQPEVRVIRYDEFADAPGPTFLEFWLYEPNDVPVFSSRIVHGWYSLYSSLGKKSFFSDNAVKYGSPPIISMIAKFKKYVDGYPVVHLDRERDFGESIVLINPYAKPVVADVVAHDGRRLPRVKVPAGSARWVDLGGLLVADEREWLGQVQITASNRLVTFEVKHRLSNVEIIADHEHLDPYRADPTHMPATLKARVLAGAVMRSLRSALRGRAT
jgi:hypothetical protein